MQSIADAPIRDCRVTTAESGIYSLLMSREFNGMIGFAVFLVDAYCLGVKDSWGDVVSSADYHRVRDRFLNGPPSRPLDPPSARKLVDDAVEFAAAIGFSPRGNYSRVRPILNDIDPEQAAESFEMGHEGKPMYVSGPHDTPGFCRNIHATLQANCGQGNYDFIQHVDPPDSMLEELGFKDDDDDEWVDDD